MKKVKKTLKSNIFFIISILIIVAFSFIYSYYMFYKKPIDNKELYIINKVDIISEDLDEEKSLMIDSNETKLITLTVENNFNINKKFYIWYQILNNQNNINIGSITSSAIVLNDSGNVIEKNSNQEITLGIKNNNTSTTKIKFGIVYGDQSQQLQAPDKCIFITNTINISKPKEYSIGDKIILNDYSSWHVIKESLANDDYIVLLNDNVINIEDTNQALDVQNNQVLFDPNDENINFYLENNYKKFLEESNVKIGDQGEIRLITLDELLTIGNYNYKNYNYYQAITPPWLTINTPWWTMTPFSTNSTYYVHKGNIYYAKEKDTTRAALRPVIKVLKTNIKS